MQGHAGPGAELIDQIASIGESGTNITLDFGVADFGTGYNYIGIKIKGDVGGVAGNTLSLNNVVVPEPATVGMLGLGALIALLVRRIRA